MGYFDELLKDEIKNQKENLESLETFLRSAPEGTITAKKREKSTTTFYQKINNKKTNITRDLHLVSLLIRKKVALLEKPLAEKNLKRLELAYKHYAKAYPSEILKKLPSWCADNFTVSPKYTVYQNMEIYDPRRHIHETQAGVFVRSKSEVIIVNTLHRYGISFEYEKPFIVYDERGNQIDIVYPDFTIILPNGKKIIWEHFGLLSDPAYCDRSAKKLNYFQNAGYQPFVNLIITTDNNKGSCNSQLIDYVVRTIILEL